jgi:hypothetical protein
VDLQMKRTWYDPAEAGVKKRVLLQKIIRHLSKELAAGNVAVVEPAELRDFWEKLMP